MDKPPFRIPSTAEILGSPRRGLTAVSTFSGAGGGCLGLIWSGFDVAWASEFVPAAADTYRANFSTHLDTRDIREVTADEIRDVVGTGEIDLLEGSPPCASFSTSGTRQRTWGDVKQYSDVRQRVDDLFFEYIRLVEELRPRAFVAENVRGLTIGVARGYLKEIVSEMRTVGYRVSGALLDAQWLGVPQRRKRLILVGLRDDVSGSFQFPEPLPYRYTIAEALDGVPEPTGNDRAPMGGEQAIWREWDRLKPGEQSSRYFNLVRTDPHDVCPTVTQSTNAASVASVVHFDERRKFHVTELKRISGFPDDFVLTGEFKRRVERLGRSVVPPMYRAVGEKIADVLEGG